MARKKKTGAKGGKDEEKDKKPAKKVINHSQISELVFDHAPTSKKGRKGTSSSYSLSLIRDQLRSMYAEWDGIEQTMRERAQDAIASENNGDDGTVWENAADRLRHEMDRQKHNEYSQRDRQNANDARKLLESQHEDFLYFQNITNRNARSRMINPIKRQKAEAERQGRRYAYKLELCFGQDYDYFDWLHDLLEYYDDRGIADMDYRRGRTDRMSNWIPVKERRYPPVLGPEDLHLWTPRRRRVACGLPPRENDTDDEADEYEEFDDGENENEGDDDDDLDDDDIEIYDQGAAAITAPQSDNIEPEAVDDHGLYLDNRGDKELGPLAFELDNAAIEKERNRVDSIAKHEHDDAAVEATHNVRRARQLEAYTNTRLNTSNIRVLSQERGNDMTEDRWRELQTTEGLFIAAKETSRDWLTSYDCLDRVDRHEMPGNVATSAIRETEDLSDDEDLVHEATGPARPGAAASNAPPAGATASSDAPPTRKGGKKRSRPDDDATANTKPSKKRKTEKADERKMDYPYPRGEFWRAKRERPANQKEKSYPTSWAEMTDGRREWHDLYQQHSPASSVDSPPHVPMKPGSFEDIPAASEGSADGFWDVVAKESIDTLEPSRRRCGINPERCRAWWNHDAGQCWFVDTVKTDKPVLASDDYAAAQEEAMNIDATARLTIPADGIGTYRKRLEDHYGLRPSNKSRWPKRGIRVPYEPFTHDDRKLDPEKATEEDTAKTPAPEDSDKQPDAAGSPKTILAPDAHKRAAFSFRSMDVPITHEPVEDWGEVESTPPPSDESDDDEESEDEGDLFRKSYIEASRPSATTAPPPGTDGGNGGGDAAGDSASNPLVVP